MRPSLLRGTGESIYSSHPSEWDTLVHGYIVALLIVTEASTAGQHLCAISMI